MLLVAVGRRPLTDDLGLDGTGVRLDDRGFVEVVAGPLVRSSYRAEQMLQSLAEGQDFAAAAEAVGAAVSEPALISRQAQDVDQSVLFAVFTAGKPTADNPVTGRTQNMAGGYTVYSVDAVLPGRPESIPLAERDSGKQQLAQQSGFADLAAFVMALRADADIIINEDVLTASDLL